MLMLDAGAQVLFKVQSDMLGNQSVVVGERRRASACVQRVWLWTVRYESLAIVVGRCLDCPARDRSHPVACNHCRGVPESTKRLDL